MVAILLCLAGEFWARCLLISTITIPGIAAVFLMDGVRKVND
jgi:hypothetical protein